MSIVRTPIDTFQWRFRFRKKMVERIGRKNLYVALKTRDGTAVLRMATMFKLSAQHLCETIEQRDLNSDEAAALVDRFYAWCNEAVYRWLGNEDPYGEPEIPAQERTSAITNSVIEALKSGSGNPEKYNKALETFLRGALDIVSETANKPIIVTAPTANTRLARTGATDKINAPGSGTATISSLAQEFEREMKYRAGPTTINRYLNHLKLLSMFIGDKPVAEVRSIDLHTFIKTVSKLPADWARVYRRRYPEKTLSQIIEDYPEAPKVNEHTLENYLSSLRMFFEWAETNAYVWRSPAIRLRVKSVETAQEKRKELSHEDLVKIFEQSPLYVGCRSKLQAGSPGSYKVRDHRFWFPLIGLYSGLRISEISILSPEEICELDGILSFDLRERDSVAAKTVFARRVVPIHPDLLKFGFAQYVEERRQEGDETLWPELPSTEKFSRTKRMSHFWHHHRKQIGVTGRRKPFYSLRHTFITALYRQETKAEIIAELAGHYFYPEFKTRAFQTHRRYIKGSHVRTLKREIDRLEFGLNLSHIYV